MRLYVDLETLQLIEGPGFRNPVTALRFKRGDSARLEVSFLQGGSTPASIGDPGTLEIQFGIKPRNRYDVGYLVHSADWTLPAPEAESPVYLCSPSFNTVELDSALGVGSSTGTELAEITLMGEITWREGSGDPTSTRTFLVIVENDVNRGTEGVPTDADPAYPAPESILLKSELNQHAVRYDAAQTPLDAGQISQFLSNLGQLGTDMVRYLDSGTFGSARLVVEGLVGTNNNEWLYYEPNSHTAYLLGDLFGGQNLVAAPGYGVAGDYVYDSSGATVFDMQAGTANRRLYDGNGGTAYEIQYGQAWHYLPLKMNFMSLEDAYYVSATGYYAYNGSSYVAGVGEMSPTVIDLSTANTITVLGGIIVDYT